MLAEDPLGYSFPVYDGPRAILDGLPGDPIHAWGGVFLILGALTLALRASGSRVALVALAGAWAVFGASALALGFTSPGAALLGGLAFLIIAVGAARGALEYQRVQLTVPLTPALREALWASHLPPQKGPQTPEG